MYPPPHITCMHPPPRRNSLLPQFVKNLLLPNSLKISYDNGLVLQRVTHTPPKHQQLPVKKRYKFLLKKNHAAWQTRVQTPTAPSSSSRLHPSRGSTADTPSSPALRVVQAWESFYFYLFTFLLYFFTTRSFTFQWYK